MKRQIENFSNYYWKDGQVYKKQTNKLIKSNNGLIRLQHDNGKWTYRSLRKFGRLFDKDFKTYKQIEEERGVKYKPMFENPGYLFCQDVEDELKVWSNYNNLYNTPYRIKNNNHLRYSINGNRVMFYAIVWQYYNQQKIPQGYIVHHIDGDEDNQDIDNLQIMTREQHNTIHKKGKHWRKNI